MVKGLCLTIMLAISAASFSQQTTLAPELTKQDYLQKGLRQRHTANAMFWGGFAVVVTGAAISYNNNYGGFLGGRNNKKYNHSGDMIAFTGLASMTGSVPFYIAYRRNKKKDLSLSLKTETVPQLSKQEFISQNIPSLAFKISL